MGVLAPHHLPRGDLVAALGAAPVAVVLAGGGYGKTSLTLELAASDPSVVRVALPVAATPTDVVTATARAARLQGHPRLRERLVGTPVAADHELDTLVDLFVHEPDGLCLVLDDIEHVSPATGALLEQLAHAVTAPHRLILVGRALPEGCTLERLPTLRRLEVADLALSVEQTGRLLRDRFEVSVDDGRVVALHAATGGWAAGLVMLAQQAAGDGAAVLDGGNPQRVLGRLVDRLRAPLDERDRWVAAQLAHLPSFDGSLADELGRAGTFRRLTAAGLAVTTLGPHQRRMAGPLAERVRTWAPLDAATARRAAASYHRDGDLFAAVRLLVAAGCHDDAARRILDDGTLEDDLAPGEIVAVVDLVPLATRDTHPWLEIVLATAFVDAGRWEEWSTLLDRLDRLASRHDDPRFSAAVAAERALEQIYVHGRRDAARELIEPVIDRGDDLADRTLLRANEVLTRVLRFDQDVASFHRARAVAEVAVSLARTHGSRRAQTRTLLLLAKMVLFPLGRTTQVLRVYDEMVATTRPHSHERGYAQMYRAEALIDLGDHGAARVALEEAEATGVRLNDPLLHGATAWYRAIIASQREDAEDTIRWQLEAQRRFPVPLDRNSAVLFHRDRVEQGLRIGRPDVCRRALRQLDRIEAGDGETGTYAAQARAFHAALYGDPAAAVAAIDELQQHHPTPRDEWRRHLYRAAAYERLGDPRAGAEAATGLDVALQLGGPDVARIREPRLTRQLAPLAADAGAPTTSGRRASTTTIRALGQFAIEVDGHDATPSRNRSSDLVQVVVVSGGRLSVERAIDLLWPDADGPRGRQALRNALHRLPHHDRVLVRRGSHLELPVEVTVDAAAFRDDAIAAREQLRVDPEAALPAAVRIALRYTGPLLPTSTLPVVVAARHELARRAATLCDHAARAAVTLGRHDDAIELLRGGIDADPHDEGRRIRLATLLLDAGRPVDAGSVLADLERQAADLGVTPGRAAAELRRRLATMR